MATFYIAILVTAGLLLGLAALLRVRRARRRSFMQIAPGWRDFLHRRGLMHVVDFLELPAPLVSGHRGRSVARAVLTEGGETIHVYLKREYRVSRLARWNSWAAGFGFASQSLREARTLEQLAGESLPCPEWLAAGEDERGRAFLLVRAAPGMTDLREWLRREMDPAARRRLAKSLGAAVGRMHDAGFSHGDLYSKHVLVGADGQTVQFLDWQRAGRRRSVDVRRRARDLAALHVTLTDELVRPRERLTCLRAYAADRRARRGWMRLILTYTRRLLHHRHIGEKRQPPLAAAIQEWTMLDGGAVQATPALAAAWPGGPPQLFQPPLQPLGPAFLRRWLTAESGSPALLVRRRRRLHASDLWRWLCGRPTVEAEQRQAELLFRLQRYAVEAPRVLAMGRRAERGWVDSFVLMQPTAGAVGLTAWLARRPTAATRSGALTEAGALLRRLHDAACYLDGPDPIAALAVHVAAGERPRVLLAEAQSVRPLRRLQPSRARRDLAAVEEALRHAGCGPEDHGLFRAGYRRSASGDATTAAVSAPQPNYRTPDEFWSHGDSPMSVSPPQAVDPPVDAVPVGSLWSRLWRGVQRLRQQPDWTRYAGPDWPDRVMDVAVADRFHAKQGRSTCRWVLDADGPEPGRLAVYLKRHSSAPWWRRLLATVRPGGGWSPAFQEWDHLEWARRAGVPVPRPVAAAEFIGPAGRLRSFLAVEELHDMLPLNEAVPLAAARLTPAAFQRWKRGLIAEVARLTRLLHDRRRFHKDLYLCHFFIAREDALNPDAAWRGRVFLIDLHRLGRHSLTWLWWRMKDLAQLMYSTEIAGVGPRDRLYFWRMYRGAGPRGPADRWLVRLVLFKWRRYRSHNMRKKAREALRNNDSKQMNAPAGGGAAA